MFFGCSFRPIPRSNPLIPVLPPAESESDDDDEEEGEQEQREEAAPQKEEAGSAPAAAAAAGAAATTESAPAAESASASAQVAKPADGSAPLTLKERMARLQAGAGGSSTSSAPASSAAPAAASGLSMGLKERMAALAAGQVTSGSSMSPADGGPEGRVRASSFRRKQAGLAMTLGSQMMLGGGAAVGSMPLGMGMAKSLAPHHSAVDEEDEGCFDAAPSAPSGGTGGADDADHYEYELPSVSQLADPQKTGFLEKLESGTGLFSGGKAEHVSRFVILKDDGLFWLAKKSDPRPRGMLCLGESGVSIATPTDCELVIIAPPAGGAGASRTYQFRAGSPEEMAAWVSKIKVARLMFGVGGPQASNSFLRGLRKHAKGAPSAAAATSPPAAKAMAATLLGARSPSKQPQPQPAPAAAARSGAEDGAEDDSMPPPPPPEDDDDAPVALPAFGSGAASASAPSPGGGATGAGDASSVQRWTSLLQVGSVFTKYKYGKGQKRLVWASAGLDQLHWGDEKKKSKGCLPVAGLTAVRDGVCAGSKRPALALTVVSDDRLLELEAIDETAKAEWIRAINWLISKPK